MLYVMVHDIENNPDQKSKCAYECNYIMKHVDITGNLLHDNLACSYVCMNSHEIYKKLFETMYVTQIGNKMQNNCKAEMCR